MDDIKNTTETTTGKKDSRAALLSHLDDIKKVYAVLHGKTAPELDALVINIRNKVYGENSYPQLKKLIDLYDAAKDVTKDIKTVVGRVRDDLELIQHLSDKGEWQGGHDALQKFAGTFMWELINKDAVSKAGIKLKTVIEGLKGLL